MTIDWLVPDDKGQVDWPALPDGRKGVLTIGSFDGVHRGHQQVIDRTVELARNLGAISVAVVLDPRPAAVHARAAEHEGEVAGDFADPDELMPVARRLELIAARGVDRAFVIRYTMPFAAVTYISFLGQMVGKVGMRTLVLGADAHMGAGAKGDVASIRNLALATGVFELDVVDDAGPGQVRIPRQWTPASPAGPGEPADPLEGMTKAQRRTWSKRNNARPVRAWSSSRIRYLLGNARIREADAILGRPHGVEGTVVHGEERGRILGFPTANLGAQTGGYVPVDGVYWGWLVDLGEGAPERPTALGASDGAARRWPAMISIGTKETFEEATGRHERVIEANACTDEWLELYGHRVRVEFGGFLRPQTRFENAEALSAQLSRDAAVTLDLAGR